MAIELSRPELSWEKNGPVDPKTNEKTWQLCLCVKVENTGAVDVDTSITFEGNVKDPVVPGAAIYKFCGDKGKKVKIPKNSKNIEVCCCELDGLDRAIGYEVWFTFGCPDAAKDVSTPHENRFKVPLKPK